MKLVGTALSEWCQSNPSSAAQMIERLRNELDRMTVDRNYHADLAESWKAQFHSAAAAASEYSEFWEAHHGDFDQFGNYIPYSQMDGDLRAAKAEIERLKTLAVAKSDPRGPFFSTQWEREDYERRQRGEPELGPRTP
jgi:hypothetical protein